MDINNVFGGSGSTDWAEIITAYGIKAGSGLLVIIIGWYLASIIAGFAYRGAKKSSDDETLPKYLRSIVETIVKAVVIISGIGMMGVETTSFLAILGSAGLAIGLALQGSLANFAGSVLILIFKPFKVGEVIEAQGHIGEVMEIGTFNTTLVNAQQRTITIPNGPLSNGSIVNFTRKGTLRCEVAVGIAYDADIKLARETILEVVKSDPRVLKDTEPMVVVSSLGASSVDLSVRAWTKTADHWDVFFDLNEKVKVALDEKGIEIPFPQTVIHQAK